MRTARLALFVTAVAICAETAISASEQERDAEKAIRQSAEALATNDFDLAIRYYSRAIYLGRKDAMVAIASSHADREPGRGDAVLYLVVTYLRT